MQYIMCIVASIWTARYTRYFTTLSVSSPLIWVVPSGPIALGIPEYSKGDQVPLELSRVQNILRRKDPLHRTSLRASILAVHSTCSVRIQGRGANSLREQHITDNFQLMSSSWRRKRYLHNHYSGPLFIDAANRTVIVQDLGTSRKTVFF